MLEILETQLRTAASPELSDAITQACEHFEDYELPGYQDAYTDLLMSSDNREAGDLNISLAALTVELQTQILDQLLILVGEDITVQQGNLILKTLRQLETTEFNEIIVDLCDDQDTDNALCEILGIVSGLSPEDFYGVVHNVDRCVLDRIKMVSQQNGADTISPINVENVRKLIDRLIAFRNFTGKNRIHIYDDILNGQMLGLPFEQYYRSGWEAIIPLNAQDKAVQLIAMTIVSDDARENPRPAVVNALSKTYTSADEITPIVTAFESILLKFHAEETSGVTRTTS